MQRKALIDFATWYRRKDRKPLIIRGARQVGKSTLVMLAAEALNVPLLTVNLEEPSTLTPTLAQQNIDDTVVSLELFFNFDLRNHPCLLFFDEIQSCPEILALLRYFYEKYPQIAVVAAGSLLEFELAALKFSMPVGRTEFFHLGPMGFEEYLEAIGELKLLNYVQSYVIINQINDSAHQQLTKLLRQYLLIGGMPAAINSWINSQDLNQVFRVKSNITTAYALDFHKYQGKTNTALLSRLYLALPAIVGKKIKYSDLVPDMRSEPVKQALQQLYLAKIAYRVTHTAAQGLPLAATQNLKLSKIICLDVGLMLSQQGLIASDILNATDITLVNQGQVAEQFIGQHLLYGNTIYQQPALHYWVREGRSNAELDFVTQQQGKVCAIEVKAGKGSTLRSLHQFMFSHSHAIAIRFSEALPHQSTVSVVLPNGKVDYHLYSLPHYLVGQLSRLLAK